MPEVVITWAHCYAGLRWVAVLAGRLCMQGQLPAWVNLPCSAALPFGAFEAVLGHHQNTAAASAVQGVSHLAVPSEEQLAHVRSEVTRLDAPAELQQQVTKALQQSGEHSSTTITTTHSFSVLLPSACAHDCCTTTNLCWLCVGIPSGLWKSPN